MTQSEESSWECFLGYLAIQTREEKGEDELVLLFLHCHEHRRKETYLLR